MGRRSVSIVTHTVKSQELCISDIQCCSGQASLKCQQQPTERQLILSSGLSCDTRYIFFHSEGFGHTVYTTVAFPTSQCGNVAHQLIGLHCGIDEF